MIQSSFLKGLSQKLRKPGCWSSNNQGFLLTPASFLCIAWIVQFSSLTSAANDVVRAELSKETVWTGEPVKLVITLYSPGPFSGTASFDLPELPKTAILKVGNPVVGSETVDGESLLTQRHEFLVFTQQSGTVKIPSFQIRFKGKKSFVGDAEPVEGATPELNFESQQPPGTESLGVVVATSKLEATQEWIPAEKTDLFAGDVVQRTLTRRASGTTAMMLPPTEPTAFNGVRTYLTDPVIEDNTERGNLSAVSIETIKYQFEQPGTYELPSITFTWWNTDENELASQTLASRTFNVRPLIGGVDVAESGASDGSIDFGRALLALAIGVLALAVYRPVRSFVDQLLESKNTPENIAAQKVLTACRENDADGAYRGLLEWKTQQPNVDPEHLTEAKFVAAWNELEVTLFNGRAANWNWSGRELELAFTELRNKSANIRNSQPSSALPELNP